jgi:hypothetical protein
MRTLPAKTINLKKMGDHFSFQGVFDFPGYLFLTAKLKVLHLSAGYAHKVMVVISVLTKIIIKLTVGVNNLDDQTAL